MERGIFDSIVTGAVVTGGEIQSLPLSNQSWDIIFNLTPTLYSIRYLQRTFNSNFFLPRLAKEEKGVIGTNRRLGLQQTNIFKGADTEVPPPPIFRLHAQWSPDFCSNKKRNAHFSNWRKRRRKFVAAAVAMHGKE